MCVFMVSDSTDETDTCQVGDLHFVPENANNAATPEGMAA
jgi:hypothetical protein